MPVTHAEARRFVDEHYGPRAADVRALGAGEWSRAYAFVLDGRKAVIRFGDHVEDFGKDRVMAAYSCAALLVPAVIEIGPAGDGYFAVSERAPGDLLDGLDSTGTRAVLPGLLTALDALRDNHHVLVQGSRITAVIDWGNALYGDWLYDAAWLIFWWPWFPQWQDIDITAELEGHWEQHGGQPPRLHHRLRACLVRIGLDAMAYNAYRGRWDDLARTASQISELT
jgi:Phosphotransferase enzyme family